MSYSRWIDSEWYIFWNSSESNDIDREGQSVAIWHVTSSLGPEALFTASYPEVKAWLEEEDFSEIRGYEDEDFDLMSQCLTLFCEDVEDSYDV